MESCSVDVNQRQQGDVVLRKVLGMPKGANVVTRAARGYILAEGEHTGHAHVITDDVALYEHGGKLYLRTDREVTVTHEEHQPIAVPPGTWEIDRVREYDYFREMERRVAD